QGYQCCYNLYPDPRNNICKECPYGTYGWNCKQKCASGFYGRLCLSVCECPDTECDRVNGCIAAQHMASVSLPRRLTTMTTGLETGRQTTNMPTQQDLTSHRTFKGPVHVTGRTMGFS
ncbi:multiple epidermal growth factor-like domains protein 10, partial [Saccostrea cucullata]